MGHKRNTALYTVSNLLQHLSQRLKNLSIISLLSSNLDGFHNKRIDPFKMFPMVAITCSRLVRWCGQYFDPG